MNKCACIILNYNDSPTTINLLKKIENYSVFSCVVVVDNSSTDDSFNILSKYANKKIHVIRSPRNGGYGFGNNYGMNYCYKLGYKYAVVSNPDVDFQEESVRNLLNNIRDDTAMIAPKQLDINRKQIAMVAWKIPSVFDACVYPIAPQRILYSKDYLEKKGCIEVGCIPGAFFLVDVSKMKKIGGYDENVFMYCEETLIGIKIRDAGFKTLLLPSDFYVHEHPHDKIKDIKNEVRLHKTWSENRLYILKKYLQANLVVYQLAKTVYTINLWEVVAKNYLKRILLKLGF